MPTFDFKLFNKKQTKNVAHGFYGEIRKNNHCEYGKFSNYKFAGVYSLKNILTKKEYIGVSKQIQKRIAKHFSELYYNRHPNKELQKDYNKFGQDSFEIIIYEKTEDNLLNKEKHYQKEKGVEFLYNEKISGFYVSDAYKNKLSSTNKNTHKTKEYREKMHNLKSHKIVQLNYNNEIIKIWNSCRDIVNSLGYTQSVILSCCNGNKKRAYGFCWKYLDKNDNIIVGDARTIK